MREFGCFNSCLYISMVTLKWGRIVGHFSVTMLVLVYGTYGLSMESNVVLVKSGGAKCTLVFKTKFELGFV